MKMEYSSEIREEVLRKALSRESPQKMLAGEYGIGVSTLQKWVRESRAGRADMKSKGDKRAQDWTMEERLEALIEGGAVSQEELGGWCRGRGIHTHQLERWRRELVEGQGRGKESQALLRGLREENRGLKKELRRKEKALAETAALLVLKKKASLIWGEREDD